MPKFDLSEIEEAEEIVKEEKVMAEEVVGDLRDEAIAYLESVAKKAPELRVRLANTLNDIEKFVRDARNHETPLVRRAVWKALIEHALLQPATTPAEANHILARMASPFPLPEESEDIRRKDLLASVSKGLLEETDAGPFVAFGRTYAVPSISLFEEPDIDYVRHLMDRFVHRIRHTVRDQDGLSPSELRAGKPGRYTCYVPPEKKVNGGPQWYPGGLLTLESRRGLVYPFDASGGIESVIRQLIDADISVECETLKLEKVPFWRDAETGSKRQLLWHLISRGLRFAEWLQSARETANCEPEKFFLKEEAGICFVDIGETWRWEEAGEVSWISRPVLLVERKVVNGKDKTIKVLVPVHLVDFFSECLGEHPEGERFDGLPIRLGAVMRAAFRKVSEEARKRKKFAGPDLLPPADSSSSSVIEKKKTDNDNDNDNDKDEDKDKDKDEDKDEDKDKDEDEDEGMQPDTLPTPEEQKRQRKKTLAAMIRSV